MFQQTNRDGRVFVAHPELRARSLTYTLGTDEVTASVVPCSEQKQTSEIYALRSKLFDYYIIEGQEELGDRDEFDIPPTSHVSLRKNGELIGVARIQPVSTAAEGILPHLSGKFDLIDPKSAYVAPQKTLDMSRVGVVSDAPPGALEVLVAGVVDLCAASGFSTIVAFTPTEICGWKDERRIPYKVISGDKVKRFPIKSSDANSSSSVDLVITSFETSNEVAERFLNFVHGRRGGISERG